MFSLVNTTCMRSVSLRWFIHVCNLFSPSLTETWVIFTLNLPCTIIFRQSAAIITTIVLSSIWIYQGQIQIYFAAKFKLVIVLDSHEVYRKGLPSNSNVLLQICREFIVTRMVVLPTSFWICCWFIKFNITFDQVVFGF